MVDRRRAVQSSQSPMAALDQLPARVVLERLPVPALAVTQDGAILFANTAFADMLGYGTDEVLPVGFQDVFCRAPAAESVLAVVHAFANMIVELAHRDGSTVRALMSRSALMRSDDQVALATFQDLTEQLWIDGG